MGVFDRFSAFAPYIIIPSITWFLVMWSIQRAGLVANPGLAGSGGGEYAQLPEPPNWHQSNEVANGEQQGTVEAGQHGQNSGTNAVVFADADVDERVKSAVECLTTHGTYKDGCWWKLRREVAFATLEYLASLPKEKLDEFSFNNSAKLEFSGGYSGWAVMDLLVPTYECNFNQLRKIGGNGDGAKWICGDLRSLVYDIVTTRAKLHEANGVSAKSGHKPCVIYSLGSNGKFEFEQAANTEVGGQCEIHTFDCTGVWSDPATSFHNLCLGPAPTDVVDRAQKAKYKSFWQITSELKHEYISILKMDVEGAEYVVFKSMLTPENSHLLPVIIFVELHTHFIHKHMDSFLPPEIAKEGNWVKPMWDLVKKLDEYGYVLVAKERNEWNVHESKCCTEYLFVRIKSIQGLDLKKVSGFGRKWRTGRKGIKPEEDTDPSFRLGLVEKYPG